LGLRLSEQAKLTYLQEKIKEARSAQKGGWILFILGLADSVIGFGLSPVSGQVGILMGIVGIPLAGMGLGVVFYYIYQYNRLLEQLKLIATVTPKCPKCGKELPQGDLTFCPFCGTSLKT
jgi:hypothetical protein